MAKYTTWMDKAGYHEGLSMIEVLALSFHQDFYLDNETADETVKSLIDRCPDHDDLRHLRAELSEVIAMPSEEARIKYLNKLGLGYFPPNETVADTFSKGKAQIDIRLNLPDQSGL